MNWILRVCCLLPSRLVHNDLLHRKDVDNWWRMGDEKGCLHSSWWRMGEGVCNSSSTVAALSLMATSSENWREITVLHSRLLSTEKGCWHLYSRRMERVFRSSEQEHYLPFEQQFSLQESIQAPSKFKTHRNWEEIKTSDGIKRRSSIVASPID